MKAVRQRLIPIAVPTIVDPLSAVYRLPLPGNTELERRLTVLDFPVSAPFPIRRVYWLHDLDPREPRGNHAHKELQQLVVAVTGTFEIELDSGLARRTETLDRATE